MLRDGHRQMGLMRFLQEAVWGLLLREQLYGAPISASAGLHRLVSVLLPGRQPGATYRGHGAAPATVR